MGIDYIGSSLTISHIHLPCVSSPCILYSLIVQTHKVGRGGGGVAVKVFKNGCNVGIGVCFIMRGWEISQVSLHSWQRGANPLYFEDLSLYCLLPPFFKFCPTSHRPISCCLQSSPPPPPCHCSFCFHVSLAELVIMQYLMRYFT